MALTVLSDKGQSAPTTAPVRAHSQADLSFERVKAEEVKLRFNPFGSVSSLDKLIFDGFELPASLSTAAKGSKLPANAKRLDKVSITW